MGGISGGATHAKTISNKFNNTVGSAQHSKSLNTKQNMYAGIYN